jgi:ribosomal protein L37E
MSLYVAPGNILISLALVVQGGLYTDYAAGSNPMTTYVCRECGKPAAVLTQIAGKNYCSACAPSDRKKAPARGKKAA